MTDMDKLLYVVIIVSAIVIIAYIIYRKKGNDRLRQKVRFTPSSNGEYATVICRCCGSFLTHPRGNWKTARIVQKCSTCILNKSNKQFKSY